MRTVNIFNQHWYGRQKAQKAQKSDFRAIKINVLLMNENRNSGFLRIHQI
jgi:hypothetical protein